LYKSAISYRKPTTERKRNVKQTKTRLNIEEVPLVAPTSLMDFTAASASMICELGLRSTGEFAVWKESGRLRTTLSPVLERKHEPLGAAASGRLIVKDGRWAEPQLKLKIQRVGLRCHFVIFRSN
jgi:hypothetical protein